MTAEEAAEAAHRLSELSRTEEIRQFEEQVDGLFADGQEDEIAGMLAEWKDTYQEKLQNIEEAVKRCFFGEKEKGT